MEEIFHPSSKFTLSYYSSSKLKLKDVVIGCEGATEIMQFEHIFGTWELYVDDIFIFESKSIGFHQLLLDNLNFLEAPNNNNNWYIRNLDNKVHRIKLVPVYDDMFTLPLIQNNPTFIEHEDGSLTFCLSSLQ